MASKLHRWQTPVSDDQDAALMKFLAKHGGDKCQVIRQAVCEYIGRPDLSHAVRSLGRPRKEEEPEPKPKKPRGRPKK